MSDALLLGLASAWAFVAALPLIARAGHRELVGRLVDDRRRPPRCVPTFGPVGRVVRGLAGRRRERRLVQRLDRELPAALDLLVVAVAAGSPPRQAVAIAARWSPRLVAEPLDLVLATTDLGGSFSEALAAMAVATPSLAPVADVLTASARLGAPAAGALARLADEARADARRRAEARARVLPVKLLFPLVFLVLPAFALLTVAPALLSALDRL